MCISHTKTTQLVRKIDHLCNTYPGVVLERIGGEGAAVWWEGCGCWKREGVACHGEGKWETQLAAESHPWSGFHCLTQLEERDRLWFSVIISIINFSA